MSSRDEIAEFLAARRIAVVGCSRSGRKFGNAVRRELTAKGYEVFPVHPLASSIDGVRCWPTLDALPGDVGGVVVVVPPERALGVVREAAASGIGRVWLQQGAESAKAVALARELGLLVIHGECILMFAEPAGLLHRGHRWLRGLRGRLPT